MKGYLIIETNGAHPGLVRLTTTETLPRIPTAAASATDPVVRHVTYFNDLSAARMHAHQLLSRQAVDVESGLYRSTPVEAVAAVESIGLRHRRAFLDPVLVDDPALEQEIAARRAKRLSWDRTWRIIGFAAILFLLARLLFGF